MFPEKAIAEFLDRHPELSSLSRKHLQLVKTIIREMAEQMNSGTLSALETKQAFEKLVPDTGTAAAALRAYRHRADLTQRSLAQKCGIPQPHLSAMENGARPIGLTVAKRIATALGVDYRRLV